MLVGKSFPRVDAPDKASGRIKYTEDLCSRKALVAKICHSTIAHGYVTAIDTSEAEKIPGVIKIVTCFDVPQIEYPTAGHPYSTDPSHQDIADRLMLNRHVRFYGDDIAAVIAEDEIIAGKAVRALKVTYDELPFVLDPEEAMKEGVPEIHEGAKNNVVKHTEIHKGNFEEAIKEEGLIRLEGSYNSPMVQHCHIEKPICYAYMEKKRIVVVSATQIPHIVRRVCGMALGIPWGNVEVIKPYIGGGFGNRQDALDEPLCAFLTMQVGGRLVKLERTREEMFVNTRGRHAMRHYITSWLRPDGTLVARKMCCFSNQGAYGSHGHSIAAKGTGALAQMYPVENLWAEATTVYTNSPTAGAMRGYGMPQAVWAFECHTEDICRKLGLDPVDYRKTHSTPVGFFDPFSKNEMYYDTYRQALEEGAKAIDYDRKVREYQNQTGPIRRGIGCAIFWYNTAVWPISLEISSCRMVMNQDGSVQVQVGETEIGQGADTAYTQMAGETLGIPFDMVHVVSCQDTDVTPFGTGAYASRQTYTVGFAIRSCAEAFKQHILELAFKYTGMQPYMMDIRDAKIVRVSDGRVLMTLAQLATETLYSMEKAEHLTIEKSAAVHSNAYSFGCAFAEVEVDIPMCKIRLLNLVNVHDCGNLINPALARAQVHGGMSMGIGYALSEKMLFDEKTGRPLNNNLLDYKLSTFMDHPHLDVRFIQNPEPTSAYGTKSLGEPPVLPVSPAIRNAVLQATGTALDDIPMDPHQLFRRFREDNLI